MKARRTAACRRLEPPQPHGQWQRGVLRQAPPCRSPRCLRSAGSSSLCMTSPMRALEREFGLQPPVGCWDPRSLRPDVNAESFARRRHTDLQCALNLLEADRQTWPHCCGPPSASSVCGRPSASGPTPRPMATWSASPGAAVPFPSGLWSAGRRSLCMTSPLRALGRELGVQPHVGFWDPRSRAAHDNAEGSPGVAWLISKVLLIS